MDLTFYGANCVSVATKQARFVVDDNLKEVGGNEVIKAGDVALFTSNPHGLTKAEPKLTIDGPGEYEVANVSIYGIAARAHIDEAGQKYATIYKIVTDEIRLLVLGHIYPELSEAQLEEIGTVDVLTVPVGGNGFTLDASGALALIKKIEPKLIIPTYYADKALKFEVPAQSLEDALKNLAMEPKETVAKLKVKAADLTDLTQLVVLQKS
jgi:L-ascorbate metabolism protein UlaG (beta-lactamase superfamily)